MVNANGHGSGEGTHLSLRVHLMKGEYDATLSWPFNATITVQLLNWSSDNHHREETIPHHTAPLEWRERVVEGNRAPSGLGYGSFISHTILEGSSSGSSDGVRFINNDCVCIRIVEVTIIE